MAERTTLARPYAQAVFELARSEKDLTGWSETLLRAAAIAADPAMQSLTGDPRVRKPQLVRLFLDIFGAAPGAAEKLSAAGQNFIKLLVENRRLNVLPEIAAMYEAQRAEAENTTVAQVVSAYPLSDEQQRKIAAALQKRLGRTISLVNTVDKALLGGMVIRAGDSVIDGSARGQLERLANVLAK